MSLSTQLSRGTLALPLLTAFALLAILAGGPAADGGALPEPVGQVEALALPCILPEPPALVLAQAPADLGQLAIRRVQRCRA